MPRTTFTKTVAPTNEDIIVAKTGLTSGLTGAAGYSLTDNDKDDRLLFVVDNTGGATGPVTIYSGTFNAASQGNVNVVVGGGVRKAFVVEGARVAQSDGAIYIGSGITGAISAIQV